MEHSNESLSPPAPECLTAPFPSNLKNRPLTRNGFTLIEILVVLFIVSVVLFAALPNFLQLADEPLRREAMRLASLIRYENDKAVARKESRSISFDISRNTWTIIGPDKDDDNTGRLKSGVKFMDIITGSGGKKNKGILKVGFSPSGLTDAAVIHLSESDAVFSVVLFPYAGQVEALEGYVE